MTHMADLEKGLATYRSDGTLRISHPVACILAEHIEDDLSPVTAARQPRTGYRERHTGLLRWP